MARRPSDYLNLTADAAIRKVLGDEEVMFSDIIIKINRKGVEQERILLVSNKALYNLNKAKKIKRRISLMDVDGVSSSTITDELTIHVSKEYDYRYSSTRKAEAIDAVLTGRFNLTGDALAVNPVASASLKDVTVTRTGPKKPVEAGAAAHGAGAAAGAAAAGAGAGPAKVGYEMSVAVGELNTIKEGEDDSE